MKFIKDILKGMVMGIANIIPGVSGGTMAVSMGIYDVLIHSVTHIFKEFKKSFNALLPIGIGMVVGILGLSRLIEWMFDAVPIQTNLLFIGLIIGGLPAVWNRVKGQTVRVWHIVGALAFFALVVGLAVLDGTEGSAADLTFSLMNCVKLFVVGVIAAATMVIPGVSGSMMLMLMGYYNPILETINGFIDDLIALNWDGIWAGVGVLAPCGIGILVGILGIAKLIEILLVKAPYLVFWCIIGLIVASPIAVLFSVELAGIGVISVLVSVLTFVVGFIVAMKLGE